MVLCPHFANRLKRLRLGWCPGETVPLNLCVFGIYLSCNCSVSVLESPPPWYKDIYFIILTGCDLLFLTMISKYDLQPFNCLTLSKMPLQVPALNFKVNIVFAKPCPYSHDSGFKRQR